MTKHTPGPWRVGVTEDSDCRIYADAYPDHAIARTYGQDLNGIGICQLTGPKNKADARLIAAAPELLSALWAMATSFHAVRGMEDHMKQAAEMARAAIEKATGGPA